MIVLLIMAITASVAVDTVMGYESAARPERAARECLAAFRYARQLAVTTGKSTRVSFDTTNNAFSVSLNTSGSTWVLATQPLAQGSTYTVTMDNTAELRGTTISLNPTSTTTFTYSALGNLDNATTVTFSYGAATKALAVTRNGDAQVN
jgi:type II secretory pathway pseudopilin PulG